MNHGFQASSPKATRSLRSTYQHKAAQARATHHLSGSLSARTFTILIFMAAASPVFGHGVPIDVFVNSQNQLYADVRTHNGNFALIAGILLATDLPGVGVTTPANGLTIGTSLSVDVHRELLYWDTAQVSPTSAELTIDNPAGDQSYLVDGTTGSQSGMFWGAYDGNVGWHQDGGYILDPSTAPAGVYGLVIRLTSPTYDQSQPILVAFNHELTAGQFATGKSVLEDLVFLTADISSDGIVDIGDFTLWADSFAATGFGLPADLSEDSLVDIGDFTIWADNFGATSAAPGQTAAVPEPAAISTIAIALGALLLTSYFSRRTAGRDQ